MRNFFSKLGVVLAMLMFYIAILLGGSLLFIYIDSEYTFELILTGVALVLFIIPGGFKLTQSFFNDAISRKDGLTGIIIGLIFIALEGEGAIKLVPGGGV